MSVKSVLHTLTIDVSDQSPNCLTGKCIVTAHRPDNERVVITGMGVASCFGNDVDTFYDS